MPIKQRTFLVLVALDERQLHGYAIRQRVLEISDGAYDLDPGGLYRLIARLERDGLVEPVEAPADEDSTDERRVYYGLTNTGRETLVHEARRLAGLLRRPELAAIASTD